MLEELEVIKTDALTAIGAISDESGLEETRIGFLGKKGRLTAASAGMRDVPKELKKDVGQKLNEVRTAITSALEEKGASLTAARDAAAFSSIDATLPARPLPSGGLHPLSLVLDEAVSILRRMGFALAEGPEIETEWHCFDALNTPEDHPARNESDTFYFENGKLLRTHTSSVQIRTMEKEVPPVRIIAPGSAFRRDEIDATHLSAFNQLEGLYVDEKVTLADLKGTLEYFFRELFGSKTEVRFRPHFFPFTEPSFEVDLKLHATGKAAKWIEIAGCGIVDPAVFTEVTTKRGDAAYDPSGISGFAFGMGIDRLAMIMYGIPDLRLLIENDVRFLRQFA
ncbi:MAG: phenylalanine--tRNA ligase subunit alpha [Verrucomicrobiales bacterium]|jgi:phenylalanyl-tRNA synthetase alpha chain|nr:phenylalanine--tRNA ligase subunit alpha [bacterium]MDF2378351.1 phenylalanine--tRNA ligase subunit alpha [Verrucomicrobiales bacterium]